MSAITGNTLITIIVIIIAVILIIVLLKFLFQLIFIGPIGFEDGVDQMSLIKETWLTSHTS